MKSIEGGIHPCRCHFGSQAFAPVGLRKTVAQVDPIVSERMEKLVSVVGNEKAKMLLSALQRYILFIVGHNADEKTRSEMVGWLKERYPNVKILALNLRDQELPRPDYNVTGDGPEKWLPIVTQQLGEGTGA